MKFLVCVTLIVVLMDEFHCAPLINYEDKGGYYDENVTSSSWGINAGGKLKLGIAAGLQDGLLHLGTDNDIGGYLGGFRQNGNTRTRYPMHYGNNPYGSYNYPLYGMSNNPSNERPNNLSYDEASEQYQYEPPRSPQRARRRMRRPRPTTLAYDERTEQNQYEPSNNPSNERPNNLSYDEASEKNLYEPPRRPQRARRRMRRPRPTTPAYDETYDESYEE